MLKVNQEANPDHVTLLARLVLFSSSHEGESRSITQRGVIYERRPSYGSREQRDVFTLECVHLQAVSLDEVDHFRARVTGDELPDGDAGNPELRLLQQQ